MRLNRYLLAATATLACMWAAIVGIALALAGHGTDVFVVGAAGTMLGLAWIGSR